jgi:TonB family protein
VIQFSRQPPAPERAPAARTPGAPEIVAPQAEPLTGSLDLSGPRALAVPSGRLPQAPLGVPAAGAEPRRIELPGRAGASAPVAPALPTLRVAPPAPDDLLAQIPVRAARGAPEDSTASTAGAPAGAEAEHRYLDSGALEWRGRERKVLRAVRPEFPEVLRQEGLGVDVQATFTVAPSGQVTQVEITRSSGYASVDRAVVRALMNYLFEASDTDAADIGEQQFSYRLERTN